MFERGETNAVGMNLVISALSKTSDVTVLIHFLASCAVGERRLRGILTTPLRVTAGTLARCRRVKDAYGIPVVFDSGGYAVQTGRLDYFDMYSRLIDVYQAEKWADLYTLPDYVPTTKDSDDEVAGKVRQTVDCASLFLREMPENFRDRAIGVVHGRTRQHIEFCLDRYNRLGLRHIGFGSFGTAGENSVMNIATAGAMANATALCQLAAQRGMTVHLFGVGSPAILPWIWSTGATSYDCANWARSAGYGQVFLPLTRGYNVTHRSATSTIQRGLTRDGFEELKMITGHACDYCASFDRLQVSREARAIHNLICMFDSLDIIANEDTELMRTIYAAGSPKYRSLWKAWVGQV